MRRLGRLFTDYNMIKSVSVESCREVVMNEASDVSRVKRRQTCPSTSVLRRNQEVMARVVQSIPPFYGACRVLQGCTATLVEVSRFIRSNWRIIQKMFLSYAMFPRICFPGSEASRLCGLLSNTTKECGPLIIVNTCSIQCSRRRSSPSN
jgi:hypothetical protein